MDELTPEQLSDIEQRHAAATPGPWAWSLCYQVEGPEDMHWALESPQSAAEGKVINHRLVLTATCPTFCGDPFDDDPDMRLLAHSWEDIKNLLATVKSLAGERDILRDALRHHAIGFYYDALHGDFWLCNLCGKRTQDTSADRDPIKARHEQSCVLAGQGGQVVHPTAAEREWDTPAEDAAWKHLGEAEGQARPGQVEEPTDGA